ncbi:transmembrane protein 176A-like [Rhineura floridana]|uniref:transmembrane protein 176A-like n=1 Tax=Rhineura floridana TaxID=261503 RepID=UPI002AC7FA8B|nr:transmembrane protein 176A-like [Rhineura floridana]
MATSTVKVNGPEVAAEDSGKTVVNINISQESSLSYLCKALAARRRPPQPAPKTSQAAVDPPAGPQWNAEQKMLGGTQILLGLMSIGLGWAMSLGVYDGLMPYYEFRSIWNFSPFWLGCVLIVAGAISVVGDRRGGSWVHLATFFHLASFVACVMALITGVGDLPNIYNKPYYTRDMCRMQRDEPRYRSWDEPTPSPCTFDEKQVQLCEEHMWAFWKIFAGVRILLFVICITALGIAVFCLGNGLQHICCSLLMHGENYALVEDPEAPPPYEVPAKEEDATA